MDIALDSESKGRGFDSHWDHPFSGGLILLSISSFSNDQVSQVNLGLALVGFRESCIFFLGFSLQPIRLLLSLFYELCIC